MTDEDHSDDIALVGEYALHLLDAQARQDFENRLAQEPQLRQMLRDWEEALAPLADTVAPVAPPTRVKSRIEAQLFDTPARALGGLRRWLLGTALAAAMVVGAVVIVPQLTTPKPSYVAQMVAQDQSLIVQASFVPQTATLEIQRSAGAPAPGRSFELWLIPEGETVPISLGVLPDPRDGRIQVPDPLAARIAGATLAISDEPFGGSPTGQATGPILAFAPVTAI